jgi:transcriptional regulator with XRE-family HTH domain
MTNLVRASHEDDSQNYTMDQQPSTNLISRDALIGRLSRGGRDARTRFVESHLGKTLAFQIRSMRDAKNWSQGALAEKVGMNQNAISRLESPTYGRATLTTLKRIATAFDVALVVRFVPFSQMVSWVTGTSHLDGGLSQESLRVASFDQEMAVPELGSVESELDRTESSQLGRFLPPCETPGSALVGFNARV